MSCFKCGEACGNDCTMPVSWVRNNEREQILKTLQSYFELTKFSEEHEGAEPNLEWDNGFQAAMALVRSKQ